MPPHEGLRFSGVTASYGGPPVLRAVTLSAMPGELTGLVGPNGSGKTSLARVASRLLRPSSGSVTVEGVDPYSVSSRRAARLVAVVPQEVAPAFSYSVLEFVSMGRAPYLSPWGSGTAEDWRKVRASMAAADVSDLADRRLEDLSGGERQRVILAQALAQDAPALLLDEPTTHLDLRHVVNMLDVVHSLARSEGKSVLAIFHDLNLATLYCDRIYAIDRGEVVAAGRPEEVVTAGLLRSTFGVEAEVQLDPVTGRPRVLLPAPSSVVASPVAGQAS